MWHGLVVGRVFPRGQAPPGLEEVLGQVPGRILSPVDQVLTLAEAVEAYTIGGAKMLGIDDKVGTIEVGKKADLILLSQNLFEIDPGEIPKTKVLGTMFDGKIVHDVLYDLGDSEMLAGVAKFPARVKCASLAWKTLEQALKTESTVDPVTTDERTEQDG